MSECANLAGKTSVQSKGNWLQVLNKMQIKLFTFSAKAVWFYLPDVTDD